MLILTINNIKEFVGKLLSDEYLSSMLLYQAELKNATFLSIDGKINEDFYDNKEEIPERKYATWEEVKGVFFQAMRGQKLPVSFKVVLMPSPSVTEKIIERYGLNIVASNISAMNLNIYYDRSEMTVTTGTSLKIFSLDRSVDEAWEDYVKKMFTAIGIEYEIQ